MNDKPLLQVRDLGINLAVGKRQYPAVLDLSFDIHRGEIFGLVGESGCGKSISALALMGLLRSPLSVSGGTIRFDGREIQGLNSAAARQLRGSRIAMIFQEPMTALNPLATVGRQIAEMFVLHLGASWRDAERSAVEALASVRVPAPEHRAKAYPHQLSGGMRQRVMIAMAMACGPDLLIADEPTTALDVTVQAEILELMKELCAARGTAILMISHDLGLIANMCARVGVMYAGRLVEQQDAARLFKVPSHPYTAGLIGALPIFGSRTSEERQPLKEVPGTVPAVTGRPPGCNFSPRCAAATDLCLRIDPEMTGLAHGGLVRCHHHA